MTEQEIRKILSQETELSRTAEARVQETYGMIRELAAREKEEGKKRKQAFGGERERNTAAGGVCPGGNSGQEPFGRRVSAGSDSGGGIRRRWFTTPAVAALCLLLALTAAASVYAVSRGDFIQNLFGAGTRESVQPHTDQVEGGSSGVTATVTYPAREYVDTEEALVEKLLGGKISEPGITRTIGDYTLTLQYAVTDGLCAGLSYKLECPEGITAMEAEALNNEAKGISFTDDRDFYFTFQDGEGKEIAGKTVFDTANSTDACLYLYETAPLLGENGNFDQDIWHLHLEKYEKKISQLDQEVRELDRMGWGENIFTKVAFELRSLLLNSDYGKNPVIYEEDLPFAVTSIGHKEYQADGESGVSFRYSPMAIVVELPGNDAKTEEAGETVMRELSYLSLQYRDGSSYLVYDADGTSPVDNTNYLCYLDGRFICLFNRLVDWEEVESMTIDDRTLQLTF